MTSLLLSLALAGSGGLMVSAPDHGDANLQANTDAMVETNVRTDAENESSHDANVNGSARLDTMLTLFFNNDEVDTASSAGVAANANGQTAIKANEDNGDASANADVNASADDESVEAKIDATGDVDESVEL